jgi:hypothetical protein
MDVTSSGFTSFCLTDARLGMFHQRHKALGTATLYPAGGQLLVDNLVSNVQDGVAVELPSVSEFDVDLQPIELTGTNLTLLLSGYGTSGFQLGTALGTVRIDNRNGFVQIGAEMGIAPEHTEVLILSNGSVVGTSRPFSGAAIVDLPAGTRITGCALLAKTMATLPGFAVRVDGLTTFTNSDGTTCEGDEVRMLAEEPVVFESIESFVMLSQGLSSFFINGERASYAPAPEMRITRSSGDVMIAWPDANRVYFLEAAASLEEAFSPADGVLEYAGNQCRVTMAVEGNDCQFFRLRRFLPGND